MKKQDFIDELVGEHGQTDVSEYLQQLSHLYDDLLTAKWSLSDITERIEALRRRLVDQEPIQYISGISHFYGHQFVANPNVLIPRPETEELVYEVAKYLKGKSKGLRILEIGTGSGCIAISIKEACPQSDVLAIDISQKALETAAQNADNLDQQVDFELVDFTDRNTWSALGRVDVIVSNPPYIPYQEQELMSKGVLNHEPHIALFVDDQDPLLFYRLIAEYGKQYLLKGGKVYLELNEYNALSVISLYKSNGYRGVQVLKDLQGKDRILVCHK